MKHMILKYFRKRLTLLFSFLIIPAVFIIIGNLNLVFLVYMSFTFSFAFIFDDFSYAVALPISRKDIVIANYTAYWILAFLHTFYISSVLFLGMKFLNFATDQSLSLLGILYSLNILGVVSLIIPFSLECFINQRIKSYAGLFTASGFLLMFPILAYFDVINKLSIIYQFIFTISLIGLITHLGIKSSLKKIQLIDF